MGCSRHWFFGANIVLDGQAMPHSLFQLVKAPLKANPRNSVIGFHDNSSAIRRALGLPYTEPFILFTKKDVMLWSCSMPHETIFPTKRVQRCAAGCTRCTSACR